MNEEELKERLGAADGALGRAGGRAPSLVDLERRQQRRRVRRGGAMFLAVAAAATVHWRVTLPKAMPAFEAGASAEEVLEDCLGSALDERLASLTDAVAELRRQRSELRPRVDADAAIEASALGGFRALYPSAKEGDGRSIEGLRMIAERFQDTHGGRCARLFLEGEPVPAVDSNFPGNDR